jgi:hypothetical protein
MVELIENIYAESSLRYQVEMNFEVFINQERIKKRWDLNIINIVDNPQTLNINNFDLKKKEVDIDIVRYGVKHNKNKKFSGGPMRRFMFSKLRVFLSSHKLDRDLIGSGLSAKQISVLKYHRIESFKLKESKLFGYSTNGGPSRKNTADPTHNNSAGHRCENPKGMETGKTDSLGTFFIEAQKKEDDTTFFDSFLKPFDKKILLSEQECLKWDIDAINSFLKVLSDPELVKKIKIFNVYPDSTKKDGIRFEEKPFEEYSKLKKSLEDFSKKIIDKGS